ncbi:hypothetical protein LCGC14_2490660 [marine sediment metagenome]|uniref:Uncharacterized protein n=1 Tax=marine sediment metagenome TaxID=412755 RepID=A0A0F9B5I0_9ZZZZ
MNLTKEQVEIALAAGLSLTNPESDLLEVFRKHAAGVMILRQLLMGIGSGEIALSPATQLDPAAPPGTPPAQPNKGPAASRGAKKRASKKVSKKARKPKPTKKK